MAQKVIAALRKCLRGEEGAVFISNDDADVVLFDDDLATRIIKIVLAKVKCTLKSIDELVKDAEPELKKLFEELKSAFQDVLQNDLKKCAETKEIKEKLT